MWPKRFATCVSVEEAFIEEIVKLCEKDAPEYGEKASFF